jgi:CheY-like chemotaxis protein
MSYKPVTILMADDDPDDRMLAEDALKEARLSNEIRFVEDGQALMDYLHQKNQYAKPETSPRPSIILLDLNMPKKDGREALKEIKSDPELRRIPVVIMTTSKAEQDIIKSYDLGANSYLTKPVTFDELVSVMRDLGKYWFNIIELPDV